MRRARFWCLVYGVMWERRATWCASLSWRPRPTHLPAPPLQLGDVLFWCEPSVLHTTKCKMCAAYNKVCCIQHSAKCVLQTTSGKCKAQLCSHDPLLSAFLQLGDIPFFSKLGGVKETLAYKKGKEMYEDMREKYETSDNPAVHKVS